MEIKSRSEIDPKYTWDLTRVFADDEAWEAEFTAIRTLTDDLSAYAGTLASGKTAVLAALKAAFDMMERFERLCVYAMMRQNEDASVTKYLAMNDRAGSLNATVMTAFSFLVPELLALPEGTLEAYEADPDFADYSAFLHDVIRKKPHTLSAEAEQMYAMAGDAMMTADNTSEMLRTLDLNLGTTRDEDGKQAPLTDATFVLFLTSMDRQVRRRAFNNMMTRYAAMGNTFAALYAGQVKVDMFCSRVRHFASSREASMFNEDVPESVYDSLIEAVHQGIGAMNAYLLILRAVVGVPKLHMYDLYCGNVADFEIKMDIEEAFQMFLKAVEPLGRDYVEDASRALNERWIDVYENKGKRSGAYSCGSSYGSTPYVLLNYKPNYDGVSTLCHEMGHAMHSYYSNKNQPFPKADYSIFVAEVASTTNEILLNEYLRREYRDSRQAQIGLIGNMLEHFRTTVFRQTLFAEFEMKAHQMAEAGESLTQELLSKTYYDLVKQYYGRVCVVDKSVASEWMRIPHFYSPFYVYKYATSFCAATALAQNILSGDPEKIAAYRRFLTLGSSMSPIEELKVAGVDLSTPEPVCKALDYFADLVLEYHGLLSNP
ncbi:MAG: oligoendopeptidase F [Clostridia bacterium]|nr:oligoendopeptidase F [Clostridia bacterium]